MAGNCDGVLTRGFTLAGWCGVIMGHELTNVPKLICWCFRFRRRVRLMEVSVDSTACRLPGSVESDTAQSLGS